MKSEMSANFNITVLGPNGRRTNVKATLGTSILQIIEEACIKQKLNPDIYNAKHINRILASSSTVQYSNIPNNSVLELVESSTPRKESLVTVIVATYTGQRLIADFTPAYSLWDILLYHSTNSSLKIPSLESGTEPVIVYTLRRISGEDLKTTTLRSLGLFCGKCMLRYNTQNISPDGPQQANISAPLVRPSKASAEPQKITETGLAAMKRNDLNAMGGSEGTCGYHLRQQEIDKTESDATHFAPKQEGRECLQALSYDRDSVQQETLIHETKNQDRMEAVDSKTETELNNEEQSSLSTDIQPPPEQAQKASVIKIGDHDAILFNFDDAPSAVPHEETDEFFELSVAEVTKLYQDQVKELMKMEEAPIMTGEMRQMERDSKLLMAMNRHPVTQLRICFPDRNVIQASFRPRTTIQEVMDFIRPFLIRPDIHFYLYTNFPMKILSPEMSLVESSCIPKARLYFGCSEQMPTFLSEDTLQKKSSFEGAAREIVKAKGSKGSYSYSATGYSLSSPASTSQSRTLSDSLPYTESNHLSAAPSKQQSDPKKPKWFKLGNK